MADPTTPAPKHQHTDDGEHPILEAFGVEEIIEEPGELDEEPDTAADADAPAP